MAKVIRLETQQQKEARLIALTCYDGEYVQFIFEDGSMTFGYIPA